MRSFAYERPASLAEATSLLAEAGEGARILAGGTDLVVGLRDDTIQPDVVVDLKWIEELMGPTIVVRDGRFTFNALATMTQIEHDVRVLGQLPALAEAARVVGSVQIRNRATLAGNICNGSPAADTSPPQLLYGAVVVAGGQMLWYSGLRSSTTLQVTLASSLSPVIGVAAAYLVLGEVPMRAQFIGGAIILAGIALGVVASLRKGEQPAGAPCMSTAEFDRGVGFKGI